MIGFYVTMVGSLLGEGSSLSKTIAAAQEAAQKRFYDLVKQTSVAMLQSAGRYPSDLMPPRVAQESLARLQDILDVYSRSMVPSQERETSFAPVLTAFLDPLLQMCRQSAEGLGLSDTAIFMLNNIVEMQVRCDVGVRRGCRCHCTCGVPYCDDSIMRVDVYRPGDRWTLRLCSVVVAALVIGNPAVGGHARETELLSRVGITGKLAAMQAHDGSVRYAAVTYLHVNNASLAPLPSRHAAPTSCCVAVRR
jgi:hypothetical protein